MDGFTGLLEGFGVLAAAFGGLIWADRRRPGEERRRRHPGLPPRLVDDRKAIPEVERPVERESEIRDHLYGDAAKVSAETGVLRTERVPGSTRRVPTSTRREDDDSV